MANLLIPYTTPANYTYDSNKVDVAGGITSVKENLTNMYARLHMNEATGATVLDTSGNGRDGTPTNSPVSVAGKLNNALSFNGSTQDVNFGNIANFERTQAFSVAMWVKTSMTGTAHFINHIQNTFPFVGWQFYKFTDQKLYFSLINNASINTIQVGGSSIINIGSWVFIVMTYDGSSNASGVQFYVNNVAETMNIALDTLSLSTLISTNLYIGRRSDGVGYVNGDIDETLIVDRVLTVPEINYLWNGGSGREDFIRYSDDPPIELTNLFDPATVASWDNFVKTDGGGNEGTSRFTLYKVDKANEYYWNGSIWVTGGSSSNSNTEAIVNTNIGSFDATPDKIGVKEYLISDSFQRVETDLLSIGFTPNQVPLVNAGTDKNTFDNLTISPFSDCSFSDSDGTVDFARYKVDGEVDIWTNIPIGGHGSLLEAVQAFNYQFTNSGILTVRLQVEDNDADTSEDSLLVTVSKYTRTVNIKDAVTDSHLLGVFFDPDDGTGGALQSSPFDYSWDFGSFDIEFTKSGYNDKSQTISVSDESDLDLTMTEQSVLNQSRASIGLLTDSDKIAVSAWLEINGAVVTSPTSCEIWLFDNDNTEQYHPSVSSSPNVDGIFSFSQAPSTLPDTQVYYLKVKIIYLGISYISVIPENKINRIKVFPDSQVFIDVDNGESGTAYPIGTPSRPVDNLADALIIASANFLTCFHVIGQLNVSVSDDIAGLTFVNNDDHDNEMILNGSDTTGAVFRLINLSGTLNGKITTEHCLIGTLTGFTGHMKECLLSGTLTLTGSEHVHLIDCRSGVPGTGTPVINMGGSGRGLGVRAYSGGIKLINKTGSENVSLDFSSGQAIVDSSVTVGDVLIRGSVFVANNAPPGVVIDQSIHTLISRALGLVGENYRFFDITRVNDKITDGTRKLYPTSADVDADTNEIAEYDIDGTYVGGKLTDFKSKKI